MSVDGVDRSQHLDSSLERHSRLGYRRNLDHSRALIGGDLNLGQASVRANVYGWESRRERDQQIHRYHAHHRVVFGVYLVKVLLYHRPLCHCSRIGEESRIR